MDLTKHESRPQIAPAEVRTRRLAKQVDFVVSLFIVWALTVLVLSATAGFVEALLLP